MQDGSNPGSRKERKQATRLALRQAALRCFARRGFVATSIADITDEAGVAKGTFYVHYEDKEALIDELLVEFNDALAERLARTFAEFPSRPLESTVRTFAGIVLEHWMTNATFVRAYAERSSAGLDVAALPFGVNAPVRDMLVAALRARGGSTLSVDPEMVVQGMLAMWLRLGLQSVVRPQVLPNEVIETLTQLTVGALERILGPAAARPG